MIFVLAYLRVHRAAITTPPFPPSLFLSLSHFLLPSFSSPSPAPCSCCLLSPDLPFSSCYHLPPVTVAHDRKHAGISGWLYLPLRDAGNAIMSAMYDTSKSKGPRTACPYRGDEEKENQASVLMSS